MTSPSEAFEKRWVYNQSSFFSFLHIKIRDRSFLTCSSSDSDARLTNISDVDPVVPHLLRSIGSESASKRPLGTGSDGERTNPLGESQIGLFQTAQGQISSEKRTAEEIGRDDQHGHFR